jgi:hypothetical protein
MPSYAHNDAPEHLVKMMVAEGARRAHAHLPLQHALAPQPPRPSAEGVLEYKRALEAQRAVQRRERAEEDEASDEAERKRKAIAAARWDAERSMSPEERAFVAAAARAAARAKGQDGGAMARRKY